MFHEDTQSFKRCVQTYNVKMGLGLNFGISEIHPKFLHIELLYIDTFRPFWLPHVVATRHACRRHR